MQKLAIASAILALASSSAMAVGGPLIFVGNTASFNGFGGITSFAGLLATVNLTASPIATPPGVVNVLSGFIGVLSPGAYSLRISGNAGAAASYGGNVVLSPVPEPEACALMLAGLGVVGFMAARRRNRS